MPVAEDGNCQRRNYPRFSHTAFSSGFFLRRRISPNTAKPNPTNRPVAGSAAGTATVCDPAVKLQPVLFSRSLRLEPPSRPQLQGLMTRSQPCPLETQKSTLLVSLPALPW